MVVKGLAPPSVVRLTLYAGYEWIQFAPPSDSQTSFRDDGFLFNAMAGGGTGNSGNGTGITNVAFSAGCGTGTGCSDKILQVFWTGAKYAITNNLDVIGAYYHYDQNQFVSGWAFVPTQARTHNAPARLMHILPLSTGGSCRSGTLTSVSCSRKTTADWRTATSLATTSIRRPEFASASEKLQAGLCKIVMTVLRNIPLLQALQGEPRCMCPR
jgi:hypothetical protein